MLEDYAKHLAARHLTPQTITNTLRQLRAFMQWRNDDDWRSVTLDDLTGWHDWLLKQPLASITRCCKVWSVKRFLGWLHQRRHILTNPAAKLPPLHKTKPLPRGILTPEQLNSLVNAPTTTAPEGIRDRAIFALWDSSGRRSRPGSSGAPGAISRVPRDRAFRRWSRHWIRRWTPKPGAILSRCA